ncbi:hypothetical protein [Mycobacterium sp. P7213]|uniref:hypothetical protein n=1 Tax=Mycobacterium sp. P7213 TaxID=2478465 RepID=UPI003217520C
MADDDLPDGVQRLDVRLIDAVGKNPNLDFVLHDTVRAVEQLRAEARTVFLCVQAASRTPPVAALYGARRQGIDIDRRWPMCVRRCRGPGRMVIFVRRCGGWLRGSVDPDSMRATADRRFSRGYESSTFARSSAVSVFPAPF